MPYVRISPIWALMNSTNGVMKMIARAWIGRGYRCLAYRVRWSPRKARACPDFAVSSEAIGQAQSVGRGVASLIDGSEAPQQYTSQRQAWKSAPASLRDARRALAIEGPVHGSCRAKAGREATRDDRMGPLSLIHI